MHHFFNKLFVRGYDLENDNMLIARYSSNTWNALFPNDARRYNILERDINTIVTGTVLELEKLRYSQKCKDVIVKTLTIIPLGEEYLNYIKEKHKFHNRLTVCEYADTLSDENKLDLWRKYSYDTSYNQYFVPFIIKNLTIGESYNIHISDGLRDKLKKLICEVIEYPLDEVYVMSHFMHIDDAMEEKDYIKIAAEQYMDHKQLITKHKYDHFVAHDKMMLFLLPVVSKIYVPDYQIDIDKFLKERLTRSKLKPFQNRYCELLKDLKEEIEEKNNGIKVVQLPSVDLSDECPIDMLEAMAYATDFVNYKSSFRKGK